ncbi:unnamed protein product, partial [Mesorhabditis belari]|uniref:Protein Abitram n=1 Tax=Mesorhabditis belari TaxID=2138241 RepID=A0AAF3J1U9_9BILA
MALWHTSAVDRSFQRLQVEANPSVSYLHHPSGVTVLSLNTDFHTLPSPVMQVDFGVGKKSSIERGGQAVIGKSKKGALLVQKETKLCIVRCEDGSEIVVRAGVKGTLLEVNDRLKMTPDLIRTASENQGYIAIITYGGGKRRLATDGDVFIVPKKRVYLKALDGWVLLTEKMGTSLNGGKSEETAPRRISHCVACSVSR